MKTRSESKSEIHRLLFMTAKQAHQGIEQWFLTEKIGITPLQFGILRAMEHQTFTLNELARRMMFKPPSLLPSIDLLERHRYVMRRNDPHDRRKIHLITTAKGKKTAERIVSSRKIDLLSLAFKRMTAPKKKQLISLLMELNEGMMK